VVRIARCDILWVCGTARGGESDVVSGW
jgi:hypothetical protein